MQGAEAKDLTARLANVARLTPHAIVLCDAAGRIEWVNDGFTAMTGGELAEAAGRTPGALLQCPETDGFMAIQADITAARNDRIRLNSTSVALKAAGRLARLGAWEVDILQQVVRWSPELAELLGRPHVVEGALDTLNVYAPEVQEAVQAHIGQAIAAGERIDFEAPAITGAGERIWLRVMG